MHCTMPRKQKRSERHRTLRPTGGGLGLISNSGIFSGIIYLRSRPQTPTAAGRPTQAPSCPSRSPTSTRSKQPNRSPSQTARHPTPSPSEGSCTPSSARSTPSAGQREATGSADSSRGILNAPLAPPQEHAKSPSDLDRAGCRETPAKHPRQAIAPAASGYSCGSRRRAASARAGRHETDALTDLRSDLTVAFQLVAPPVPMVPTHAKSHFFGVRQDDPHGLRKQQNTSH